MPYKMCMSVDGACRGNGYPGTRASAAVVLHQKWGGTKTWSYCLPSYPTPTNQRAELSAIIHALKVALQHYHNLDGSPFMEVEIETDSKYAYGCMTDWRYKWQGNGFINSAGIEVTNRDLVEEALDLEAQIETNGKVVYEWVPRGDNTLADAAANEALDETSF
ncbi:MAG: hypothetical protein L6R40_004300 [Gallowayella cf. fulva]|nr:MAG: hypothetical protein L6R40_004300 [Xanthomendoza cf. fulva]